MVRRVILATAVAGVILALVLVVGAVRDNDGDGNSASDGAAETMQIENSLQSRMGEGTVECVRLDDGDQYRCIADDGDAQQIVNVNCDAENCIYRAEP